MAEAPPIKLFESVQVRSRWDEAQVKWYFSVVDVLQVLTESARPRKYWSDLKVKLQKEGGEGSEKAGKLKMHSPDGKARETDAADVQTLLRLIQSIPSPKAKPFTHGPTRVGDKRMQEFADPAQSQDHARENWRKMGRSDKWIQQRMTGQETRNKLTDHWQTHGVEGADPFALLANLIHQEWAVQRVIEHKFPDLRTLNDRSVDA